MARIDVGRLAQVGARFGEAAVNPEIWPELMQEISTAVQASGATLLQSDIRTADVPRTAEAEELTKRYFAEGWQTRDDRVPRGVPLLLSGRKVICDDDLLSPDELRHAPMYNELLARFGLKWGAIVGFWAGSSLWAMTMQRSSRLGPFASGDKLALAELSNGMTEAATLSKAVGRAVLDGTTAALSLVQKPALALDRFGFVLAANAAAEQIFDDEIRICNRRLILRDQKAKSALESLIDQLRTAPDLATLSVKPLVVSRRARQPIIIRVLPVPGAARSPFLGARALLVLNDLSRKSDAPPSELIDTFGLSPAEAKLAALVAAGSSPQQAAEKLGIARETARNQLKAVFAKTGTHRQSELGVLLAKL